MSHDTGRTCPCVTEHRPKVVELDRHHVEPVFLGGEDIESNVEWICPNTHRAAHEVLREYLRLDGPPPGSWLDDYPRMARELALRGWRAHLARRHSTEESTA